MTRGVGTADVTDCLPVDCLSVKCDNKASCAVENHKAVCLCRPG